MKQNHAITNAIARGRSCLRFVRIFVTHRGQAAVEFALVATVAMIVLFVAVQLALLGEDALAIGQMNYQGARWAAVNTCATHAQVYQYMLSVGSPSVTKSGGTCGAQLKFVITDDISTDSSSGVSGGSNCTAPTATTCGAGVPTRTFGNPVKIQVIFDASKAIFLGNGTRWLGLINLPTTLTSTESAMAE
jgi:Flp pilus assembly protein TadG